MERLLPQEALHALMLAIELEILSQELDADVVRALPPARSRSRATPRATVAPAGVPTASGRSSCSASSAATSTTS